MVAENWNHEGLEGNGDVTSEEVTVKVFSWGAHEVHIRDSGVGGRESGGEQEPLLASVVNLLLGCLVGSWWTEPSEPQCRSLPLWHQPPCLGQQYSQSTRY